MLALVYSSVTLSSSSCLHQPHFDFGSGRCLAPVQHSLMKECRDKKAMRNYLLISILSRYSTLLLLGFYSAPCRRLKLCCLVAKPSYVCPRFPQNAIHRFQISESSIIDISCHVNREMLRVNRPKSSITSQSQFGFRLPR